MKSEDSKGSISVTVQNQTHIHKISVSHNGRHHHLPQTLNFLPESPCNYYISAIRDAKGFETFDRNVKPHRPLQSILNYAAGTLSKSRRVESNSFHLTAQKADTKRHSVDSTHAARIPCKTACLPL